MFTIFIENTLIKNLTLIIKNYIMIAQMNAMFVLSNFKSKNNLFYYLASVSFGNISIDGMLHIYQLLHYRFKTYIFVITFYSQSTKLIFYKFFPTFNSASLKLSIIFLLLLITAKAECNQQNLKEISSDFIVKNQHSQSINFH